jgi:hypothetical protein
MTYGKKVAAMPPSSYQTQDKLRAVGNDMAVVFSSHEAVLRDHAVMIDEIRDAQEKLEAFIHWVEGTYPEVMGQYKAIKDIERSANA